MQDNCATKIMKKHAGRPKIGTQNAKSIYFTARFTPVEAKEINGAIRRDKQSKTGWIRKALLSAAGSDKSAS
ncbi:MAG: hypothetical protein ACREFR_05020 [Limisphaerales bacterium]